MRIKVQLGSLVQEGDGEDGERHSMRPALGRKMSTSF